MEFILRIEDAFGVEEIFVSGVECAYEKFHKYFIMQPYSYIDLIVAETGEIVASNYDDDDNNLFEVSGMALNDFCDNWTVTVTAIELN